MNNDKKINRYAFFEFNGKYYGTNTIVKFKPHVLSHLHKKGGLYGRFYNGRSYDEYYAFKLGNDPDCINGCTMSIDSDKEIYTAIEKIIVPYEVPYVSPKDKKCAIADWEDGELIVWWVIYILVMFVGSIFYIRLFIWAIASIIFFGCRNEKLKEYGYK